MRNLSLKRSLSYMPNQFLKTTHQTPTLCHKHFLNTVSESANSSSSSFTVQYLINACGFPLKAAISASQNFQLEEKKSYKHDSVLSLFKSLQFSDTHIIDLLSKRPWILKSKVHNNLEPKLHFLRDNGFVGPLLPDLILSNPVLLGRSLTDHIEPAIIFLKKHLHTNEKVVAAVKRSSWLLTFDLKRTMQPNINFLLSAGVPSDRIAKLVVMQPRAMLQRVDKLVSAVELAKKLGLKPNAPMFIHAIRPLVSMSDSTWNRKVELFKSLGWSEEQTMSAFRRDPLCLACSEEKIRDIMGFYVNTMKLDPGVIAAYPKLLMYAVNTRIRPRYMVLKVLESKKLIKENRKFTWILTLPEKEFLKTYVINHLDQVPNLLEMYRRAIAGDKIDIDSQLQ